MALPNTFIVLHRLCVFYNLDAEEALKVAMGDLPTPPPTPPHTPPPAPAPAPAPAPTPAPAPPLSEPMPLPPAYSSYASVAVAPAPTPAPRLLLTPCPRLKSQGYCRLGNDCPYPHPPNIPTAPAPEFNENFKTKMCPHRVCGFGDQCRYAHSKSELRCQFGNECRRANCEYKHITPHPTDAPTPLLSDFINHRWQL